MSQKEIQESLELLEKDWDVDPILHDFVLGKYTDVTDFSLIVKEFYFVEIGIVFSVILLGIGISIENKIPTKIIMIFVATFGLFHGIAHGLEVPAAANPILFVLGFIIGTITLHLLGVLIGHLSIKNNMSLILLRLTGVSFAVYGIYLLNEIF